MKEIISDTLFYRVDFPQAIIGYFCFIIGFSYPRIEVGSQSVNLCA